MKKKRGSKSKKGIPKKGDPDYLTPTQLRNRRKRRAKEQKNEQQDEPKNNNDRSTNKSGGGKGNRGNITGAEDPSMKYISDPTKAPIVQTAKRYFQPVLKGNFHVHLGPIYEWRTVSKLAVRPDNPSDVEAKVAIGLFLPQSHTLLPVPNCRAHHVSINRAVECITVACHEVGVAPYSNIAHVGGEKNASIPSDDSVDRGAGQLKYVAINVARDTSAVQISLVWNTPPPVEESVDGALGSKRMFGESTKSDPVLQRLVAKIISLSNDNTHSTKADDKNDDYGLKPLEGEPTKKKRRRGRREGKTEANKGQTKNSEGGSPRGSNKVMNTSKKGTTPDRTGESRSIAPKLNLHSLWINHNPSWKHSNAIFSFETTSWRHVYGPRAIVEHLKFGKMTQNQSDSSCTLANPKPLSFPIPLHFPPNVFRQANLDAFTNIVGRIRERIQGFQQDDISNISCVELYGGVGTIGLHLSDIVANLVSSDENPNNLRCFNESVNELPSGVKPKLIYKQKNAADMVLSEQALLKECHILIVDPPRKGLDAEVVDFLCSDRQKSMKLMVYVSCGFQAFQRDCNALINSGQWRVEFAEGYLLFPGSDAIETLAFFVPL